MKSGFHVLVNIWRPLKFKRQNNQQVTMDLPLTRCRRIPYIILMVVRLIVVCNCHPNTDQWEMILKGDVDMNSWLKKNPMTTLAASRIFRTTKCLNEGGEKSHQYDGTKKLGRFYTTDASS